MELRIARYAQPDRVEEVSKEHRKKTEKSEDIMGEGGWEEGWERRTSRMTPTPQGGFGPPIVRYVFHSSGVVAIVFSVAFQVLGSHAAIWKTY